MLYGQDTDSFIFLIKTEDLHNDISDDVKKWFDMSHYEVDRPLPGGIKKKIIALMKDELGGNIMTEFVALRPKTYSYLMDDGSKHKRAKGTKKFITKRKIKFKRYKKCFFKN